MRQNFSQGGIVGIDADLIAREMLLPGSPCIAQLQEKFGADIADENGNVRRRLLADRAFATPAGTRALTAITQPEILHRIETRLQEASRAGQNWPLWTVQSSSARRSRPAVTHWYLSAPPTIPAWPAFVPADGIAPEMARRRLDAQTPIETLARRCYR